MDNEKNLLLDIDGVMANFIEGVSRHFKVDLSKLDSWHVNKHVGLTLNEFWRSIHCNQYFWEMLPDYDWTFELFAICKGMFRDNMYFCSSPSMSEHAYSGKYLWINDRFPTMNNKLILTNNKHLLANKNTILIDDSDKNCKQFYQSGGQYILFPQPWNNNRGLVPDRIDYVKDKLNQLTNK